MFDSSAFSTLAFDEAAFLFGEGDTPTPTPTSEVFTGGFVVAFEREMRRRDKDRRKREDDEAQALAAQQSETDREIAAFLHEQEARDAERREIERLRALVQLFADQEAERAFNERVAQAYERALAQQTASALLAFEREMKKQFEEEEFAILMALALED